MDIQQLAIFLLIGAVAGWLAGLMVKGGGFGILGNIIVGVLGAIFGGWLFAQLGISTGNQWIGSLITATVGAVVLVFLLGLITRKNRK
jgi:uncharacterized membrane protein YeaQ/YmgE (transglycosylase-associated protein family)